MARLWQMIACKGFIMALCAAVGAVRAAEPPVVVTSMKPLYDLAAGVMAGIARPHLLVPPGSSPHAHALRPSAARLLDKADLVVWIGPGLENFLTKPIGTLGRKALSLALIEGEGMVLLPARDDHADHAHAAHADHAHDDHADYAHESPDHDAHALDPHLWLDPHNGRQIARLIARALTRLDPERTEAYRANLTAELAAIDRAEAEVRAILTPVRHLPYVVFHDAFQYFERRFATASLGAITPSPERAPGARRISAVRARITALGARCVFSEPQFEPALVRTIVRGSPARTGVLDPLGGGASDYGAMLVSIARAIRDCLAS